MIQVGDLSIPWQEEMTVSTLLATLEDGHIYAVVRLNGKLVSRPNFGTTPVPDGAWIVPIPMIAGG